MGFKDFQAWSTAVAGQIPDVNDAVVLRGYQLPSQTQRLYLSAKLDTYVDFDPATDLIAADGPDSDGTMTVWLRPSKKYRVVTTTRLIAPSGYLRGRLLDAFLEQPDAQIDSDGQNLMAGKLRTGPQCYA